MNAVPKSRAILAVLLSATLVAAAPPLRVDADEAVEPTVGEAATIEEALPGEGDLGSGPEAPLPEEEPAQDPEQAEPAPEEVGQDPEEQAAPEDQAQTDESLASQDQAPEPESAPTTDSEPLTSSGNPDDYLTATGDIPGWGRAGETFTVGDITYKFLGVYNDANQQVARLYAYKYNGSASSITIPDVANGYQVYGIAYSGGSGSWQVPDITVSKGIKEIGSSAFANCTKLQSITFAPGSELKLIGACAFEGCTSLTSFTMPPKLEHIDTSTNGAGAFDACYNLTDIYFNDILNPFQSRSVYADGSITYEGYYNPCPRSRYVTYHVPATSKNFKVVDGALFSKDGTVLFSRPIELPGSTYTVPSGVREIASYAFFGTELLSEVNFPNTLERIGRAAFSNSSLTSVTIPDSVTFLGTWAFQYSKSLVSVHMGNGIKDLTAEGSDDQFMDCTALSELELPEGLEKISVGCFYKTNLTSVHIPSTVTLIDEGAFADCKSLATVTGAEGVKRINKLAFRKSALSSFPFGDQIAFVSGSAFTGSTNFDNAYPSSLENNDDYDGDGTNDYVNVDAMYDDVIYVSGTREYDMANEVLALVNQERAAEGLSALTIDSTLTEAAMQRAAECSVYYDHTRPTGRSCFTVTSLAHAENIAAAQTSASAVMNSWMNSSGHRANILAERSKSIGIGCFKLGGIYYWVQLFGPGAGDGSSRSGSVAETPRIDISYSEVNLEGSGFNLNRKKEDPVTIEAGTTYQLVGGILNAGWSAVYAAAEPQTFTWTSSDSTVATVSQDGLVTAGTKAGTATITATTRGGYTLTRGFQVTVPLTRASVGAIADQTYTGAALTPKPTVKMGSATLKEGTDYTLSYTNNVNVGTGTVTITGKGNYSGTTSKTFAIKAADITKAQVTAADQTYDGTDKKPTPTVTLAGKTLVPLTDFLISYSENTNAGTATVTVYGKGNYTGEASGTFKIAPVDISGASVSSISDYTYTGAAITPEPSVRVNYTRLAKGTDYTLTYANNVNAGTATVTIAGKGNYSGSTRKTFNILPVSITRASVDAIQDRSYTGAAITPKPAVRLGSVTLKEGTDYTLTYASNVNAGTATLTVNGRGSFTGSVTLNFRIAPANIAPASISGLSNQTYTGSAIAPKPTVKMGSATLKEGTDYSLAYKGNVNAGTATVTVTGKGNYTGSANATFRILAADIAKASVAAIADQAYTSAAIAPKPAVKMGSTTLAEGTDYTLSYKNNVAVGTAIVTVAGKGNYAGSKSVSFKITAADISKASVSGIGNQTYTGSALTPKPTVKMGATTLSAGTHYTLSYKNNVNAGTATITITGKGGNYTGSKSVSFKIAAADISKASISSIGSQTYTGLAFLPEPTVTMGSVTLSKDTDYTLSYANNVNAGTATVTVTGKGNYAGTAGTTFTIKPASVSTATVTVADQVYTGSAIKPKPTVKKGSVTLVEGTDYTLSYKDNVNAGTATVTVAGRGNYTGSKDVSFKISRASISQASVSAIADQTHTGAAIKPKPAVRMGSVTLVEGVDYTLSYKDNVNVGTATVTVTGTGGYAGSASRSFRVVAARVPMHRLYNPNTGEHFYTSDAAERDNLVRVGWSYEGVGWTAPSQSGTPVYRLYNSVVRGGDHHYTMDRAEYEHLGEVGWTQEGVGWYSDDARGVPIYREYNPNAMTGTHNYTASLEEHRHLVSLGWHDEGIGWYGLK